MTTYRKCKMCGGLHSIKDWPLQCYDDLDLRRTELRSKDISMPLIISDTIGGEGVKSMLDGKYYTSKSALRKTYRENGMIELGNDSSVFSKHSKRPIDRDTINRHKQERREALEKAAAKVGLTD